MHSLQASPALVAPKDHVAMYLVLEAPFYLGRGWLYLPRKDTLRRKIPLVNASEQPLQHGYWGLEARGGLSQPSLQS